MAITRDRPREMDKKMRHQLDVKKKDTVVITAISTTDHLHNQRHQYIGKRFIVEEEPKQSASDGNYNYRNWVNVSGHMENTGEYLVFYRCQIKRVNEYKPHTGTIKQMLDKINHEINVNASKAEVRNLIRNGELPEPTDADGWKRVWEEGKTYTINNYME